VGDFMGYSVVIKKQAKKKLESLTRTEKRRLVDQINMLGYNPDDTNLDIKKLVGEPFYRLRVGDWRIIFDRRDILKIISIEKIKSRGDVYK
jgi:mRNA interferase RelE/StbE